MQARVCSSTYKSEMFALESCRWADGRIAASRNKGREFAVACAKSFWFEAVQALESPVEFGVEVWLRCTGEVLSTRFLQTKASALKYTLPAVYAVFRGVLGDRPTT